MTIARRIYATLVLVVSLVMSGCIFGGSSSIPWDTVDITLIDHIDVAAGTYSVPYSIDEIVEIAEDYDIEITWVITTSEGATVTHLANQFTVVAGVSYEVTLTVSIEDGLYEYEKTVTVTAVSEQITITWDHNLSAGTQSTVLEYPKDSLITPLANPTQSGYTFIGWFSSLADTEPFNFATTEVTADLTLYAKWELTVEASLHEEYFDHVILEEGSYIHDGHPFQHFELNATLLYDDYDLSNEIDEYGVIYSTNSSIAWGNEANKLSSLVNPIDNLLGYVYLSMLSAPLADATTYYARPFVRYDTQVFVGDLATYETSILVESGESIGVVSHLSGGKYYYDLGTTYYPSGNFIELATDYSAILNGQTYQSFSRVTKQGTFRLITTPTASNEKYLHVFEWHFRTNPASMSYVSYQIAENLIDHVSYYGIKVTYTGSYFKGENTAYDFDNAGVLFSATHPYLVRDFEDVSRRSALTVESDGSFVNDDYYPIPLGVEKIYARAYVIEDDRISYDDKVEVFEHTASGWERTATYHWEIMNTNPTSAHMIFTSATAVTRVTTFTPERESINYTGNVSVTGPDTAYITSPESTYLYINEVVFTHPIPMITGVTSGSTYDGEVTIDFDQWNVEATLSKDGVQRAFASGVTVSEAGEYVLTVTNLSGVQVIPFSIN